MSEEEKQTKKDDLPKEFPPPPPAPGAFPATVVRIVDEYNIAINRGIREGIRMGQRFLIYAQSEEEIIDPETKENLGCLEIVRGTGKVVHLQEKLAMIESDMFDTPQKRVITRTTRNASASILWGLGGGGDREEEITTPGPRLAFEHAKSGDKAKPI